MIENSFHKKESPLVGMMGGGPGGTLGISGGAATEKTYVDDVFSTFLYNGTGSSQSINNGIDLSGEGGLVWIKSRDMTRNAGMYDTIRGVGRTIVPSGTGGQSGVDSTSLTAFNSNGFSLGSDTFSTVNESSKPFVSWTFRKQPGFFDVVTWTGNGVAGRSISHSLGSVPGMIWVKRTDNTTNWEVFHTSLGNTKFLSLNNTWAESGSAPWNSTSPTSTTFTVSGDSDVNADGGTYVAYIFANNDQSFGTDSDEAIIKCGSYTGDGTSGNAEGNLQNLGFEPQFLIIKNASRNNDPYTSWHVFDDMRGTAYGKGTGLPYGKDHYILANKTDVETDDGIVNFTPVGFSVTNSGYNVNTNGDTYIYMAIRRPHKPPTAGTEVFKIDYSEGTSPTPPQFTSGFVTDLAIRKQLDGTNIAFATRLQGINTLTMSTSPESDASLLTWDFQDGWSNATSDPPDTDLVAYMFKRAPGFLDVVSYTGTGSNQSITHNLGVAPELVIVKIRVGNTRQWAVWTPNITEGKTLRLNDSNAEDNNLSGAFQANSTFTATNFGIGTNDTTNGNNYTYISYLFASLAGISKVGEYTGTGSDINVDCGFSAGARFVMIKRTDTEIGPDPGTDWYVWDTYQGISTGNDPYWTINQNLAQVTGYDYIDPLNAGFTVPSSAPAALNASGGKYLFMAIA